MPDVTHDAHTTSRQSFDPVSRTRLPTGEASGQYLRAIVLHDHDERRVCPIVGRKSAAALS